MIHFIKVKPLNARGVHYIRTDQIGELEVDEVYFNCLAKDGKVANCQITRLNGFSLLVEETPEQIIKMIQNAEKETKKIS